MELKHGCVDLKHASAFYNKSTKARRRAIPACPGDTCCAPIPRKAPTAAAKRGRASATDALIPRKDITASTGRGAGVGLAVVGAGEGAGVVGAVGLPWRHLHLHKEQYAGMSESTI